MAGKARPNPPPRSTSPRSPLAGDRGKLIRHMESGQVAEAAATLQAGKRWRAEDATLALSLAVMCIAEGLVPQAEAALRIAMQLQPDLHEARLNLAFLLLRESRYDEAWPLYEARIDASSTGIGVPQLPFPAWRGEPLAGRSIVVFAEQGHGDTLQAVRFCALLKTAGARFVQFACPPALEALLAGAEGVDEVISSPDKLRRHDYWALAMGLPRYFVHRESDIPGRLPYLRAPADRSAAWQARLGRAAGVRVGLVWKGSPQHKLDMVRSLGALRELEPLWSVPGVRFVSLQKGAGEDEAEPPPAAQPLLAVGRQLVDFADAAAVVAQLDLVITVDTAMAHLAGALGKPVWVLLPAHLTDWRWLRDRTDSPWYPGVMRLFRQRGMTGWGPVVAELAQALRQFVAQARPARPASVVGNVLSGRKPAAPPGPAPLPAAAQQALAAANALLARGEAAAAAPAYAALLARWPGFAAAHNNHGAALSQLGRHDEARSAFEQACRIDPGYADAWFNLGISRERNARMQEAAQAFLRARSLAADPVPASRRLVGAWMALGELDRALEVLRGTAGWAPDDASLHTGLGMLMDVNGRPDDAEQLYRQALVLQPGSPEARLNLGVTLLRTGRLAEGWACYEARHEGAQGWSAVLERPALGYPRWTGQSLAGRSILVWTEQGFGDAIQFVRYAAVLKQLGATTVRVACRQALQPLLETCPGVDEVLCEGTPLPDHDFWVFALSLPFGCGTTLETLPRRLPYLAPRADRLAQWQARLGPRTGLRVGLVWKGLPDHRNDPHRSLPSLATLAPLWEVPGVQFVSLQRGPGSEEATQAPGDRPLLHLGDGIRDFGDTAAIVAQLDLVICVDTAVAHVAGALAKPCWVLLPAVGTDWRWMRDREDSPWYPGVMRLYRQPRAGDWEGPVRRIAADLRAWRPSPAPPPRRREPVKMRLTASGAVLPVAEVLPGEAEQAYRQGIRLAEAGQAADAEAAYRRALTLDPHHANAWNNLANLLAARRATAEAENAYRQALALQPGHVNALNNLASLLTGLERPGEAEPLIRQALAAAPGMAELHNTLGILLAQQRREPEAEAAYRQALDIDPGHAGAANNLGALRMHQGHLDESEALLRRAVERQPALADAWINLGFLLRVRHREAEAEAAYRRALAIDANHASARLNLCFLLLSVGRFDEAWPFHAARYSPQRHQASTRLPRLPYPAWQGEPLAGKSLLLWPEQGFGDYIQFIRYAPMLKQRGVARLATVCAPPLAELLRTAPGVDAVFTQAAQVPAHDFWLLLMDLPQRLGTTAATIPAPLPYLSALPERVDQWRPRLPAGRKVGLVWKGAAGHRNDRQRSLPALAALAPLWRVPGITFVSLQKGEDEAVAAAPPADQPLVALGAELRDFADSAAVLAQLDLLICVDTAIAHVAGALGRPVWVLLPALGTDWRWQAGRGDSPWYPGVMRLFRQPAVGDWDHAVGEVAAALAAWAKEPADTKGGAAQAKPAKPAKPARPAKPS